MPENIMKSLWDESSDLESDAASTKPVISDTYDSEEREDLQDKLNEANDALEDSVEGAV